MKKEYIILAIIFFLLGVIVGITLGMQMAVSYIVDKAEELGVKFSIDENAGNIAKVLTKCYAQYSGGI